MRFTDVHPPGWKGRDVRKINKRGYRVGIVTDATMRENGTDWPPTAETMIGVRRLRNVRGCVEQALDDEVPGDLLEAGVWRGGACILMRGILAAREVRDRKVWVCDSFAGLPAPERPEDAGLNWHLEPELAVSLDQVKSNFGRYRLLDDQVQFLEGWFADTLPGPVEQLAVCRLDGDLYASTWDSITALEPLVSPGGFVIVDDYQAITACAQAVDEYRAQHDISDPIIPVDGHGVYWRKRP